jgi:hypothetical protein
MVVVGCVGEVTLVVLNVVVTFPAAVVCVVSAPPAKVVVDVLFSESRRHPLSPRRTTITSRIIARLSILQQLML